MFSYKTQSQCCRWIDSQVFASIFIFYVSIAFGLCGEAISITFCSSLVLVRDKLKQSKFDQKYYKSYLGLEIKTNTCHLVAISISFDTIIYNIVIMLWKVSVHIAIHTRLDFTWYVKSHRVEYTSSNEEDASRDISQFKQSNHLDPKHSFMSSSFTRSIHSKAPLTTSSKTSYISSALQRSKSGCSGSFSDNLRFAISDIFDTFGSGANEERTSRSPRPK